MKRTTLAALVAVVALAVAGCGGRRGTAPTGGTSGRGTLISHTGTWTFARLGLPTIVVRPGRRLWREVAITKAFRLPKGARQGRRGKWFRLRLHYEVDIASDTGPGEIVFSVNTNGPGGTSAQIDFIVRRLRSGKLSVTSDSLGLISGRVIRRGRRQVWRGKFENYIPYPGIRAGVNSLGVRVEHLPGDRARAARAVVFRDSAIVYGTKSPRG